MSGAAWLLQGLFLMLLGTLLLGRWPRLQGLWWVVIGGGFLWALSSWPADRLILVLGRPLYMGQPLTWGDFDLVLDATARQGLHMMLWAAMLWGGIALLSPAWGRGLTWANLALIGSALAVMSTSLWATGWAVAVWAGLVVFAVTGAHAGKDLRVWQWLVPWVVAALLLFFLLIWEDPNVTGPEMWRVQLVAMALVLWTGLAPLHVGNVNMSASARPLGSAWLWWTQAVVVLTVFHRVNFTPGMEAAFWRVQPVVQSMGILTLAWVGLAALGTRDLGRLTAYAALHNWALCLIMWLAAPGQEEVVRWTLMVRFVGVYAATLGLTALLREHPLRTFDALSGWARRRPWAVAAWAIGIGTLVGAPFTPGIWSQWMMHRLALEGAIIPWVSFLGALGITAGVGRAFIALWGPLHDPLLVREEGAARGLMWAIVVTVVFLALSPQWLNALNLLL